MVACRYGISLPVLNFIIISHSFTVLTDEVSKHFYIISIDVHVSTHIHALSSMYEKY